MKKEECCEQYWTGPGSNTPHGANCTATYHLSRKLYKLDEPDMPDTAGEAKTRSLLIRSCGPPHMANQKRDDQLEHSYSSHVMIRDVTPKTCRRRWMIGRRGEREIVRDIRASRTSWWWWWWCREEIQDIGLVTIFNPDPFDLTPPQVSFFICLVLFGF